MSKVINVYQGKNFDDVCSHIDIKKSGHKSKKELMKILEGFFSLKKQNQKGVMAIEIRDHNE